MLIFIVCIFKNFKQYCNKKKKDNNSWIITANYENLITVHFLLVLLQRINIIAIKKNLFTIF